MAFYEMLPGAGMPSGLQAGMDSVLNKKFGTSTTYPAEGWPDTVNLMGPLPEKTASGAIVTFADGADAVPLKKCEITLPTSLDGYSSVNVVQSGKNILPNTAQTATENGVTFTVNSDGSVSLSGTCNADTNFYIYSGFTFPKLGQYFFSGCPSGGSTSTYRVFLTNYGADVGSGYLLNVSNLSTTTSIRINIKSGVVTDGLVFKPQIEAGSTATTYEAYTAPTTHTATLGRTIYGGKPDVVAGQGESSYKIVTVGNSGWNYYASGGYIYKDFPDKITPSIGDIDHVLITDNLPYGGVNYASQFQDLHVYQAQNKAIYIKDTSCTSADDFYTKYSDMQIGYELATPETFTFDPVPIDSKLGNNTIWSEQGSAEVTYRGQGTVYQYPEGEGVSF